jgi:hypothetical protein
LIGYRYEYLWFVLGFLTIFLVLFMDIFYEGGD